MTKNTKTVLVTGAAGHLGQAMCRDLAQKGWHVLLNGRNEEKLESLAKAIQTQGGSAEALPFDVTDEKAVVKASADIYAKFGQLDGLVNNAYSGKTGSVEDATKENFDDSLSMNVTSPFLLTQKLLPCFKKSPHKGGAAVVNIGSMYGIVSPDPGVYGDSGMNNPPFYGAGKGALIQLTRYLACHLAKEGIRVNCVSPGPFPPDTLKEQGLDWFIENLEKKVPLGRIGQPQEVAGAVVFLLSHEASYITGVNLPVDGGWTAW